LLSRLGPVYLKHFDQLLTLATGLNQRLPIRKVNGL
jgi:hypothetical protein